MSQRIVPNFGRPEGRLRPIDLDHIFKDADEPKDVSLQVTLAPSGSARDNHWTICWPVGWASGYAVQRRVHIVKELLVPHLTNWGPMTKSASSTTAHTSRLLVLARGVTLAQRKKLETIGSETPVLEPNGAWNCQDWVITVLAAAEEEGLVAHEQWTKVVAEAQAEFD